MKTGIKFLIILLSICSFKSLYGQNKELDSLWNVYKKAKHDTIRMKLLNEEIGYLYESIDLDSALIFYEKAVKIADKFTSSHSPNSAQTIRTVAILKLTSLQYIGSIHYSFGNYEKAMEYYQTSLIIAKEQNDKQGMSNLYANIGTVYSDQGIYDKAIEYLIKALKIKEELGNKKGMSQCYTNIGVVYKEQGSYDKAIEYYTKALKIKEEIKDKRGIAACYLNIGVIHKEKGNYNMSMEYYLKALKTFEELGDKQGIAACYGNVGIIYLNQGKFDKAMEYALKTLKITEELDDKNGIVTCYINICSLNISLADSSALNENQRINYLNKAVEFGTKAITLSKEINALPRENEAAETLMSVYKKLGKFNKAMEYAELFITNKDSMFNEEKTKSLAEMSTKYEAEKKQLEIEKMQKQKELDNKTMEAQTAENRKQLIIIISAIGGFLIVLIFSILILRMFRQKRKDNIILAQQKEEISTQRDEIEAQRDLVTIQKEHIEEIHKEVTDSINYAKRIQEAVLPISVDARAVLGEHFVLFKPKDIVSGDFFWTTKVNNFIYIAVADCTGHGVPGAFMSMLGISFLSEIVSKQEITNASQVIDKLRIEIINALQQKGQSGEQKDGMDMALCVINITNDQLQYAGANNPLFIVTMQKELNVIEADKMPVAIHEHMENFTNHEYQLQKGDCIYLCSDGYEDQFGGTKNKKFMAKQMKELFIKISDKPMNEQQEILNKNFEDWKGEYEQIDDVTILGLKI